MPIEAPTYKKREYLSYSTLLSFARCPRKYFYTKCGIYPAEESNALAYGTAMHKAVDEGIRNGLDAAMAAFESMWDDSHADPKRSLDRARAQISHYLFNFQKGRSLYVPLDPPEGAIKVDDQTSPYEIPFVIDIGLPIPLTGRLDGWCMHRDTGEYWGREFKTTSVLSTAMFDSLDMNPQLLTYALILRTLTSKSIRGIMFDAMLIDKSKVDCITHPVLIQDHHVDDILLWLRYHGELLLACEERGEFPKNFAGCNSYPFFYKPGSLCEYSNLCRVPDWRNMLPYYTIKEDHKLVDLTTSVKVTGEG